MNFKFRKKWSILPNLPLALWESCAITLPAVVSMGLSIIMQYLRSKIIIFNGMKIAANQLFKTSPDKEIAQYCFATYDITSEPVIDFFFLYWPQIANILGVGMFMHIGATTNSTKRTFNCGNAVIMFITSAYCTLFSIDKKIFATLVFCSVCLNWVAIVITERLKEHSKSYSFRALQELLKRTDIEIL